jgi:hypothetical protein
MSPYEIDYAKQSIKDAIAAGNNSNTWLNKFEMYGNKATNVYSPDSQNELKKLFDAEAKKMKRTYVLKIADAEDYFQKAIENDANYGWKEIVDINSDWPEQLVNALFQYRLTDQKKPQFFSLPQTLSISGRTYTAYTPNKGGDIFILYGDYNNSGENMNYNWVGAAQFKTANRTEDEIISELSEWLKDEVDYYDPQKIQESQNPKLSLKEAETHFNLAIKNYSNYGWKEISNSSDPNTLVKKLIGYPVSKNAKPEFWQTSNTLTIGNMTYVGWTPKNDNRIFILYRDYNNSGEELSVRPFKTANRTTEEIIAELAEWLKGEVDYLDPQI